MKVTVKHISSKNPFWVILEPEGQKSGIVNIKAEGAWALLDEKVALNTELEIPDKSRIAKGFWVV